MVRTTRLEAHRHEAAEGGRTRTADRRARRCREDARSGRQRRASPPTPPTPARCTEDRFRGVDLHQPAEAATSWTADWRSLDASERAATTSRTPTACAPAFASVRQGRQVAGTPEVAQRAAHL